MNNIFIDIYCDVIKNRDKKEIVNDEYDIDENDYMSYIDFIIPDNIISNKRCETKLR